MHRHQPRIHFSPTLVSRATAYDEQPDDALVIPEDLTALPVDDLDALETSAVAAFNEVYQGGDVTLTPEDLDVLRTLNTGIVAIRAQQAANRAADAEAATEAAELAAAIETPADEGDGGDGDEDGDGEGDADAGDGDAADEGDESEGDEPGEVETPEAIAASGARQELRVNMGAVRRRAVTPRRTSGGDATPGMRSIVHAAPNVSGFREGIGMDWSDMGEALKNTLRSYPQKQYANAAKAGRKVRQQHALVTIEKPFPDDLIINSDDPEHVEKVFARATDETRLPNGSLVAAGGWCAPSETIYELCELESRDGLYSVPEVMVRRGGINHTLGPDFGSLFSSTGFNYTEAEDAEGDYDGEGGGSKPCFKVECPPFTDDRLDLSGLCITAGLLQSRAYPEVLARTLRGALIAHDHRLSGLKIAEVVAGSTAVSMPASQVGALAPILTAVELQIEHMKDLNRMARNRSIEAVFPFWARGAIRADLARRQGVDLISVPDSRIDAWFRERGANPQYVYNFQGLSENVAASGATAYPTDLTFLLYPAGTWVAGGSDVITLDTVYDSTLLGTNDFTALFSEEGWLMAKRCHDSRVVTVNICPDGATHAGVAIDCNGSAGA